MTALERIEEIEDGIPSAKWADEAHVEKDVRLLLKAFKVMREIAIKNHICTGDLANGPIEAIPGFVDKEFENMMAEPPGFIDGKRTSDEA